MINMNFTVVNPIGMGLNRVLLQNSNFLEIALADSAQIFTNKNETLLIIIMK